jgi:hemerythrin
VFIDVRTTPLFAGTSIQCLADHRSFRHFSSSLKDVIYWSHRLSTGVAFVGEDSITFTISMANAKGGTVEFFKWKESFNVGIEEIDRQHRSFLELLNDCYVKASGLGRSGIDPEMIASLRDYATRHFRFEEELMRFESYPDMLLQEQQHRMFESMILEFEAKRAAGKDESVESVFTFLRDWFLNHILEEDKKIASFIK